MHRTHLRHWTPRTIWKEFEMQRWNLEKCCFGNIILTLILAQGEAGKKWGREIPGKFYKVLNMSCSFNMK